MNELHILFVEDVPAEAAMVEAALRKDGLVFSLKRVDTREEFSHELASRPPDVILSDHGLPSFDGLTALGLAQQALPDVPFIFVTNSLTRDMEIDKLMPGVTDYVPKRQLGILAPVIRRAIEKKRGIETSHISKAERDLIVARLLALLAEYNVSGVFLPICSCCKKIRDKQGAWHQPEVFFRNRLGIEFTHGICPECDETLYGDEGF